MKIVWSPISYERLENIYDFISDKDSVAAKNLINRVFEKIESLSRFPERERRVSEINRAEIREVFVSGYRIIYKIGPKKILILTIRDFKQLLPETEIMKNK